MNAPEYDATVPVRHATLMAELGLCSRREADDFIARGWVLVDGVVVNTLGAKVLRGQRIELAEPAVAAQS